MIRYKNLFWALIFLLIIGCAKNVGSEFGVVKEEAKSMRKYLGFSEKDVAIDYLGKASTVSARLVFDAYQSGIVQPKMEDLTKHFGYAQDPIYLEHGSLVFCHKKEIGKMLYWSSSGMRGDLVVRVSGWNRDRKMCSGTHKNKS